MKWIIDGWWQSKHTWERKKIIFYDANPSSDHQTGSVDCQFGKIPNENISIAWKRGRKTRIPMPPPMSLYRLDGNLIADCIRALTTDGVPSHTRIINGPLDMRTEQGEKIQITVWATCAVYIKPNIVFYLWDICGAFVCWAGLHKGSNIILYVWYTCGPSFALQEANIVFLYVWYTPNLRLCIFGKFLSDIHPSCSFLRYNWS